MKYNAKKKARNSSTNSELNCIPVTVRNQERVFLSQTKNTGGKKCVVCRLSSHLQLTCPNITIFGTVLRMIGPAMDVLVSDL